MVPYQTAFTALGGLAMFLYGMSALSTGLQKIAGKKLKEILAALTKNRLIGVAVGAGITGIMQSSSAVTVMAVGFVNAGLLSLKRGVSIILGANIGTTITAQLIAFNITKYALLFVGVGGLLNLFARKKNWQWIGFSIFGFGLLFSGLNIMTDAFTFLKSDPAFHSLFVFFSGNPLLAVLGGCLLTFILQSSSATIGITQALALVGAIDFSTAVPLVFGENIGTTITAQLASLGASRNAKRLAWSHTMFNVLGTIIFMTSFLVRYEGVPIYIWFIDVITPGAVFSGENISRHIANAHSLFNIINVLIFLPLLNLLVKIVTWLVPGKDEEIIGSEPKFIDKRFANIPSIALAQAEKEILHMMSIARSMVPLSLQGLFDPNKHDVARVQNMEKVTDDLQSEVIEFLVSLESSGLSHNEAVHHNCLLHLVNDVEKIADYALNIVYLVDNSLSNNVKYSTSALDEIRIMTSDVDMECDLSVKAFAGNNMHLADDAFQVEGRIDQEKDDFRKNHLERLKSKECNLNAAAIFNDIVNNLERISDHAVKFAKWRENPYLYQ
ncbi:phosphate:Na+ symporter [Candidatus Termititenax persephonae]|uniref:Phosphate:Na+ symporter n=1 Tax=Candidatus Termititenax persephonae TaxID=2218525 RepID=A0A388TH23_9BACT|nr:phosphate:Na+ symporter [Candidatus Termititenax persephonae]